MKLHVIETNSGTSRVHDFPGITVSEIGSWNNLITALKTIDISLLDTATSIKWGDEILMTICEE